MMVSPLSLTLTPEAEDLSVRAVGGSPRRSWRRNLLARVAGKALPTPGRCDRSPQCPRNDSR